MKLLAEAGVALAGARALVLGRSAIVGRPMVALLLAANATVTVAHSRTRDLPAECRRADVLVAAVGKPEMVRGDWIAPGATVIDVGVNRLPDGRLVGDVAFAEAAAGCRRDHAGARRRGSDDHRMPAGEHHDCRAAAPRRSVTAECSALFRRRRVTGLRAEKRSAFRRSTQKSLQRPFTSQSP